MKSSILPGPALLTNFNQTEERKVRGVPKNKMGFKINLIDFTIFRFKILFFILRCYKPG